MEEILRDLRRIARQAETLENVIIDARGRMPRRAEGTDRTGAIRAVLGPDGLPIAFEVAAGWSQMLAANAFGAAVLDAFGDATHARIAAWSRALESPDRPSRPAVVDAVPRDPTPMATPTKATPTDVSRPRPLATIVEEVLRAAEDAAAAVPAGEPQPTGTGLDASGELVLTLSESGVESCTAPAHWLSYQSADALTSALDTALASARANLASRVDAREPADRPDPLLDELFAAALTLNTS
jgi:hypothetical protein